MLRWGPKHISIMVLYATLLHICWGTAILIDEQSLTATALDALYRFLPYPVGLAIVLISTALMAMVGVFARAGGVRIALLLIPQQTIMMMTAAGAVEAMWLGHFADGVLRPHAYVFVSQVNYVIAALGHTLALISTAHSDGRNGSG